MQNSAIRINNLKFSYGNNIILNDLNIKFEKNKFHSIIGPNGSGKSTLIKILAGILRVQNNTILINGTFIEKYKIKRLAQSIACVHQNVYMDVDFTAHEIVMMGRSPYKGRFSNESKEDRLIVQKAMEITSTDVFEEKPVNSLSGGEQQRVIAARAIAQQTEIILLDEPVSHMDINNQLQLLSTMKKLKDTTIITVLHDLNLAALFSDNIVLMQKGTVVSSGTSESVLSKENIKKVYDLDVEIIQDKINNKPHVIPIIK